jgi:HEAT repeat protein
MIAFVDLEGVLDPTLFLEHMESDGVESKLYPDDLLELMLSRLVENVENTLSPKPPEELRDPQEVIAENTAIFLNTSLSLRERTDAFGELWLSGRREVSREIVVAAVDIVRSSDSVYLRKTVWQQLAHVDDPYLVDPLLESLATDPHWLVRLEAAKALINRIDEPGVREALDFAWTNDRSEEVREEIHYSVLSDDDQVQLLRTTVLDPTLPARDRSSAFYALQRDHRDAEAVDEEVIAAMVDLARSSDESRVRQQVLHLLSSERDPYLPLLLEALADDRSERVRETVANMLARFLNEPGVREAAAGTLHLYLDQPGVREALQIASQQDADSGVRTQAEGALAGRPRPRRPQIWTGSI